MDKIGKIPQFILVFLLKIYRIFISPILGCNCRFYPTCSQYAEQSLREHGIFTGLILIIKRVIKCHPWHYGGVDLVPKNERKK